MPIDADHRKDATLSPLNIVVRKRLFTEIFCIQLSLILESLISNLTGILSHIPCPLSFIEVTTDLSGIHSDCKTNQYLREQWTPNIHLASCMH